MKIKAMIVFGLFNVWTFTAYASCSGVPGNATGTCVKVQNNIPGIRCSACCSQPGAMSWRGDGYSALCRFQEK